MKRALALLLVAALVYLAALVWMDSRRNLLEILSTVWAALPIMVAASVASHLFRFLRWHLLLQWAGHRIPLLTSLLIYLSGFSFTATPGKAGELVRARYLAHHNVPTQRTFGAFVFERALDLLVVLALASLYVAKLDAFIISVTFVVTIIACLLTFATRAAQPSEPTRMVRSRCWGSLSKTVNLIRLGLAECRTWMKPVMVMQAFVLGLCAWILASWAFLHLLQVLAVDIPARQAMAIYPTAMLAGAASMIPGGLGSTEAAIVALLSIHEVEIDTSIVAAIGIRVTSLWLSILCGFICLAVMEWKISHTGPISRVPLGSDLKE